MNEQKYRGDQLLAVILDNCTFSHPVENYANTVVFWGLENLKVGTLRILWIAVQRCPHNSMSARDASAWRTTESSLESEGTDSLTISKTSLAVNT